MLGAATVRIDSRRADEDAIVILETNCMQTVKNWGNSSIEVVNQLRVNEQDREKKVLLPPVAH